MRISDWSSDVCSSDLCRSLYFGHRREHLALAAATQCAAELLVDRHASARGAGHTVFQCKRQGVELDLEAANSVLDHAAVFLCDDSRPRWRMASLSRGGTATTMPCARRCHRSSHLSLSASRFALGPTKVRTSRRSTLRCAGRTAAPAYP